MGLTRGDRCSSWFGRPHDRAGPPARGRGPPKGASAGEPEDHASGRSHGELTTKIRLAADDRCRPAGRAGDAPAFTEVTARLRVPRRRGRPRTRPDVVLADKAYSSRAIREHLRKRGIRAVIPVPADQRGHRLRRGSRGGRPPAFDHETHKQRNTVERCSNRLKHSRGLATATGRPPPSTGPDSTSRASSFGPPGDPNETA
ncbi:hypothetical protein E6R62_06155 [Streptomyces sp. A1136]|nr:hypothetical protein E6R62_06155 [Streptomyces sp. A1136]